MIKGITSSGFEFAIQDGITSDFNYLRAVKKAKSEDVYDQIDGVCDMVSVIFADHDQEESFYKHLADTYGGRVPVETMMLELNEIMTAAAKDPDVKN